MKYVRMVRGGGPEWAQLDGEWAVPLSDAPWEPGAHALPERMPLPSVRLAAPAAPSKVICVGRNYREHAAEMGSDVPAEPLLFLKPPSSLLEPGGAIVYPPQSRHLSYEGELAVIMGRRCRDAAPDEALDYVFGYTCANDVTARDLQKSDGQWTRGKGFDTFLPLGPYLVTGLAWTGLRVRTRVSGQLRQDGNTRDMVFTVPHLISYISQVMTLEPGDLILTGTPPGVGSMGVEDTVEVEIEGIGTLQNRVRAK